MKHESLIRLSKEAEEAGCFSSVVNILNHENEDLNPEEQFALLEALEDLHDLIREAVDYADRIRSLLL